MEPKQMTMAEFYASDLKAEFYGAPDEDELLTHESIDECVYDYVERHWPYPATGDRAIDLPKAITSACEPYNDLTITAYKTVEVTESWLKLSAQLALESLAERFDEDYSSADSDGSHNMGIDDADRAEMLAAITAIIARKQPHNCEPIASIVLSLSDVEDIEEV